MSALAPIAGAEVIPTLTVVAADMPSVVVIAPLNFPDLTDEIRTLVVRYTKTALTTLVDLGARFLLVDPTDDEPVPLGEDVDGLLLLGGGDVDPTLYGHFGEVPNLYGVDRRCDERSFDWIRHASSRNLPTLGICRGAQLINIAFGGDLIPDLGPNTRHHGHGNGPLCLEDEIDIEPGTRLAEIMGRTNATVRSGHHQAVGEIAPHLRVGARGVDGIIEAIEHTDPNRWVFGVQWHPEDSDAPQADRQALFSAFVARAREVHENRRRGEAHAHDSRASQALGS